MNFYDMLSSYYDELFPYDPGTAELILAQVPSLSQGGRVLDIGCATGSLALDLSSRGADVDAIDLDAAMIQKASGRGSAVRFSATDMRTIASVYKGDAFDAVVCAGNTIAHLSDAASTGEFLSSMSAVLKEGGKAFIQTVNFDLVAEGSFPGFPVIERAGLRFERSYRTVPGSKRLVFCASITDSSGKTSTAETELYPLGRFELSAMAFRAGFGVVESFAGFGGEPMSEESMYCLQIAEKRRDCH